MANEEYDLGYAAGWQAAVEACAKAAETQERGTNYQWVPGSHFETLTKHIARQIRKMLKPVKLTGN